MYRIGRLLRKHIRTRYLVSLQNDEAFEGVLVDADKEHLILADVSTVARDGAREKADTDLWIPRANVKYMQVIAPVVVA